MTISQLEARLNQVEGEQRAALANLQAQFDVLATAHAEELARNAEFRAAAALKIEDIMRRIDPRVAPDLAEFAKFVLPTENAPARRLFSGSGLIGAIGERQKV